MYRSDGVAGKLAYGPRKHQIGSQATYIEIGSRSTYIELARGPHKCTSNWLAGHIHRIGSRATYIELAHEPHTSNWLAGHIHRIGSRAAYIKLALGPHTSNWLAGHIHRIGSRAMYIELAIRPHTCTSNWLTGHIHRIGSWASKIDLARGPHTSSWLSGFESPCGVCSDVCCPFAGLNLDLPFLCSLYQCDYPISTNVQSLSLPFRFFFYTSRVVARFLS